MRPQLATAARLLLNFRGERAITFRRSVFQLLHRVTPVVAIDSNGMRFFVSTADATGGWFFAMRESFDEVHLAAAVRLSRTFYPDVRRDAPVFVDVGANIGTTSIAAVMRYGFVRAIAIEPEPSNLSFLRQNIVANALDDRVRIVPCAASDHEGLLEMELSPDNSGDHRVRTGPAAPGLFGEERWPTSTIEAKTLDAILTLEGVAPSDVGLVWVDVQGFEAHVLAGASLIVGASIPVVIEYWPYGLRRNGSLERLWEELRRHYTGFVDIRTATEHDRPEPIETLPGLQVPGADGFTDLLLVK